MQASKSTLKSQLARGGTNRSNDSPKLVDDSIWSKGPVKNLEAGYKGTDQIAGVGSPAFDDGTGMKIKAGSDAVNKAATIPPALSGPGTWCLCYC